MTLNSPPIPGAFAPASAVPDAPQPRTGRSRGQLWRMLAARLLPHNAPSLVCPPGPLPTGGLPVITVSSLMRSGTHLLIDLLLNNLPAYRRSPLYVDFDSFVYDGLPLDTLGGIGTTILKTHVVQRPFDDSTCALLQCIATKGLVLIPERPARAVVRSQQNWGMAADEARISALQDEHAAFWTGHSPLTIPFASLMDAGASREALEEITRRLGMPVFRGTPVLAPSNPRAVLAAKLRTRLRGHRAPVLNTTVGFRTTPRA